MMFPVRKYLPNIGATASSIQCEMWRGEQRAGLAATAGGGGPKFPRRRDPAIDTPAMAEQTEPRAPELPAEVLEVIFSLREPGFRAGKPPSPLLSAKERVSVAEAQICVPAAC